MTTFHHLRCHDPNLYTIFSHGLLQYPPNRSPWFYPYLSTAYFQISSWNDAFKICKYVTSLLKTLKWLSDFICLTYHSSDMLYSSFVYVSGFPYRYRRCSPAPWAFAPPLLLPETLFLALDVCLAESFCKWRCLNLTFPMRLTLTTLFNIPTLLASLPPRFLNPVPNFLFSMALFLTTHLGLQSHPKPLEPDACQNLTSFRF